MAVNSKQKGARFERLLASKFREYGYDARRGQQYCGANGDADVVGLRGLHIEAKHQETMRLYDWMAQAKRDAEAGGGNTLPAVFHKKNNAPILVTMELEDFMNLYREWEAGFDFKDGVESGKG
jgi:Holliday junction resolvase